MKKQGCSMLQLLVSLSLLWFTPRATGDDRLSSPRSFKFRALNLFPESFDWDPAHRRVLLGSAAHGTIWALNPKNGSIQEFVRDDQLAGKVAFGGLIVDRGRNRVVVAVQDVVTWRFGALAAFDLDTGRRLFLTRLDDVGVAEGTVFPISLSN